MAGRGTRDFACAHCGTVYEISESPAHDTGSAACEVCNTIMMKWINSAIPLFRAENTKDARHRYFSRGPGLDQPTDRFRRVRAAWVGGRFE